ncbi:MAG TPA: hypothetical protein VHB98_03900 [Chloroflexota bacterium]|nr:hypothetical protein [Chloroflexota bacterium]
MSLRNTLLATVLLVGGTCGASGLRPPAHASLVVSRNAAGDLTGQLTLAGHAYAISWHRISAP